MRILAIDDDPEALWLVWAALKAAGHETVRADAGVDLRQIVATGGIDAVVLDREMPERSGFELLEELRADPLGREIPVLFLSAHGDSTSRIAGLRRGADDYLAKPFEPEELLLRLVRLTAGRARRRGPDFAALDAAIENGRLIREIELGRYRLESVLGEGAMGTVFIAHDPRLGRRIVVKTLRPETTLFAEQRDRAIASLENEARALAGLNHPNVVAVYDTGGAEGGVPFVAMEYVEGPSLDDVLRLVPLSVGATVAVGECVALGLAAAHSGGVLHSDIKPANVLLGRDGSVKLSDFGVAVALSRAGDRAGVFGTPGYIAPEVLVGREPSVASDLFALGVLLYRSLTGRLPFRGNSLSEIVAATHQDEAEPPSAIVAGMPDELERLVLTLLEKDPRKRPPSALWLAEELGRLKRSLGAIWRPSPALLDAALQGRRSDDSGRIAARTIPADPSTLGV